MDATFFSMSRFKQFSPDRRNQIDCQVLDNIFGRKRRSKISSDKKRLFFVEGLYPLLFSRTLPLSYNFKMPLASCQPLKGSVREKCFYFPTNNSDITTYNHQFFLSIRKY